MEQKEEKKEPDQIALNICIDDQPVQAEVSQQVEIFDPSKEEV